MRVLSILALALLATAAPAGARNVAVEIVTGEQPADVRELGAVGLYVPGQGLYVSRQEALERLGSLPTGACGTLARCPHEVFVSVPPLGSHRNTRPYEVTILGADFRGVLVSPNTRIDGLVSIRDIRDTVAALEQGREPPLEWRESRDPAGDLRDLARRLDDARRAQAPATTALTLIMIALAAAALATRRRLIARTALVYPLAALALGVAASALGVVGPVETTVAMFLAIPAAALGAAFVPLTVLVPVFLGAYGIVLAVSPETNALMAIGPHPWSGGRFYGITNQIETFLLAPTLAAAASFAGIRLLGLGLLSLLVVGASETGADGGGILVFAAALVALWLLRERRRSTPVAVVLVAVVALGFVAVDALTGGSSHVVDAVRDGPRELVDVFRSRAERSVAIATSTVWQLGILLAGIALLAWFAALRPRFAVVDAFLVGIAVSLLVNDSPTKVAGYGAILAGALRAWSVCAERREGTEWPS